MAQQVRSDPTSVCEHNSADVHGGGQEGTTLPGTLLLQSKSSISVSKTQPLNYTH